MLSGANYTFAVLRMENVAKRIREFAQNQYWKMHSYKAFGLRPKLSHADRERVLYPLYPARVILCCRKLMITPCILSVHDGLKSVRRKHPSSTKVKIRLLYFGRPRERLNAVSEFADIPDNIITLAELLAWLRMRGETWELELNENRVRCAINQNMAGLSANISELDEVAIFSPISGG
ncbi:MAG: MoaD/ThiS family protein [Gallionellaceae bacterium]